MSVMRAIRRILVPVGNATAASLPAIDKAAQLAAAFGARLELFHDIADPIVIDGAWHQPGRTLAGIQAELRQRAFERLEDLAEPLRSRRLTVSTSAVWDYPPYEAILRRAAAIGADLIVAPRRERHRLPALLGYTDWELLRLSPIPVLLVKSSAPYRRPKVLAAIDPTHAHAKPSGLDQRILDYGAEVCGALRGTLHVMHAHMPRPLPPSLTFDTKRRKQLLAQDEGEARATLDKALLSEDAAAEADPRRATALGARRPRSGHSGDRAQNPQRHRRHRSGIAIRPEAPVHRQHGRERHGQPALRSFGGETGEVPSEGAARAPRRAAHCAARPAVVNASEKSIGSAAAGRIITTARPS